VAIAEKLISDLEFEYDPTEGFLGLLRAGHFDSLGNPCLKFHLCGVAHDPPGLEFEAIIDTGGNVTNVRVLKGLPMGLDRAAVEAVQKWKFKPATLEGRPVKVYYVLTVNFQVQ